MSSSNCPQGKGRWTLKEHASFLEGLRLYGKNWEAIATLVSSRNVDQIRAHYSPKYALDWDGGTAARKPASKRAKTRRHKGTKPTSSGSSRHPPALPPNTPDKHVVGGRPAHMLQGHMSVANAAGSPATAFFSPYSVEPNSALSSGESVRMEALTAGDSVPRLQPTTNAFSSIWPPWDLEYLSAAPTARIMSTAHLGRDQRSSVVNGHTWVEPRLVAARATVNKNKWQPHSSNRQDDNRGESGCGDAQPSGDAVPYHPFKDNSAGDIAASRALGSSASSCEPSNDTHQVCQAESAELRTTGSRTKEGTGTAGVATTHVDLDLFGVL